MYLWKAWCMILMFTSNVKSMYISFSSYVIIWHMWYLYNDKMWNFGTLSKYVICMLNMLIWFWVFWPYRMHEVKYVKGGSIWQFIYINVTLLMILIMWQFYLRLWWLAMILIMWQLICVTMTLFMIWCVGWTSSSKTWLWRVLKMGRIIFQKYALFYELCIEMIKHDMLMKY